MKFICEECADPCILDTGDHTSLEVANLGCVIKNSCYCKWKKYEDGEVANLQPTCNNLATDLQHNELPKLTAEVFDRPDCPEWAKAAMVNGYGFCLLMNGIPHGSPENGYIAYGKKTEPMQTWGVFSLKDDNGKFYYVERPKKRVNWDDVEEILCNSKLTFKERKQELPAWCKEGEWVYTCNADYRKIERIEKGIVSLSGGLDIPFGDIHSEIVSARLRPYKEEEMRGLVGKIICEANASYVATTCIHHDGTDYLRLGIHLYEAEELLSKGFTIDGKPCGVLEHLENWEWVK